MDMVRNQMLTQRMSQQITKDIKVTPSEVRVFYRQANHDSLPMVPTQYELQQIAIYPRSEQKEIDRVKDQLRDFQKQINEGRDFSTLAVLYSEDPGSATRGGELGWMTRAQLVPEFANVAFNLQEKNKVSKVVESEYGFHIIQLIDRKGERINVRHILLKPRISTKSKEEALHRIDSVQKLIQEKTYSFEEAALRFSMDKDTRANGGLMVNNNTSSSKFAINELPAEISKAIQTLTEGAMSAPILMKDNKGKDMYVIVSLKKKTDPHRANVKDDYQVLQDILMAKKKEDAMKNWIKEKQKSTYVSINKDWINCDFEYPGWGK
jgi:peptidyl-prolyl cis-trans isomerase SurA